MKLYSVPAVTLLLLLNINVGFSQNPETIKLKDYRPKSIFLIPVSRIEKAKFPVIDMHSHEYATSMANLAEWVTIMDKAGVDKTVVLTQSAGHAFDSLYANYSKYPDRFELWCGFDYTGYTEPGWTEKAITELERCHKLGAKGVGEITDKGLGDPYAVPVPSIGMHLDDPKMMPLYKKCADLRMPVNIHVADPMWMYEPMDSTNDGLMNAYTWRIDLQAKGLRNHAQLITTLENIVRENPQTTFVACHLANCEYKLEILGGLFEKYKNLYADFSARYAETATIPRYMYQFFEKYQDRLVYGTDMGIGSDVYSVTFRILESRDEHFYEVERFGYHWPLYGFGLSDAVLKKIYNANARRILKR